MSGSRNQQLVRQWRLMRMLETATSGVTIPDATDGGGESERRTFYRDMAALQEAGFPVFSDPDTSPRRWCLTDSWRRHRTAPVTPSELLALRVLRSAHVGESAKPFQRAIGELVDKLDANLTPEQRAYVQGLDEVLAEDSFEYAVSPALAATYELLSSACIAKQRVVIRYRSGKGIDTERKVDPYVVWNHRGTGYLFSFCRLRDEVRTFRVSRIQEAILTDERFEPCAECDQREYSRRRFRIMGDGTPHEIAIWFAPEAALYIGERQWHPSQAIAEHKDRSITLTLRASGLTELASWIMSFGPRAKALAPQALVEAVREQLAAALTGYEAR